MNRRLIAAGAAVLLVATGVAASVAADDDPGVTHIVVVQGEGWSTVARRCGQPLGSFLLANGARVIDVLHAGRVLHCVPGSPNPPATTEAPTTTVHEHPTVPTTLPPATTLPATQPPTTPPPTTTAAPTTTLPPTSTTQPVGVQFQEDFTNTDRAYFDSRFDVELVERTFFTRPGAPYQGDHNMDCGAPDTQRTVHNMSLDQIWLCAPGGDPAKGHVMSSAGNSEYSYTTFSPKGSYTGRQVCWDVNLTDAPGGRTWWEVTFIPIDVYRARPTFAYTSPDFPGSDGGNGFPRGSVTVDFTQNNMELWTDGATRNIRRNWWEPGYQNTEFRTTDKATRYRHCLTDTPTGLTLTQQRPTGVVTWRVPGAHLPAEYRVGFKAENYNAGKDGSVNQTWHWDAIVIQ